MTKSDPSEQPRAPLNRDRVLRAAIDLADKGGIEALTMRKLGQALGVEAMSLYNHVANKEDVLNGSVDLVVGEIELPSASEDWESALRKLAISTHAALRLHPWACNLMMSAAMVGPARLRYMNAILGHLRQAGFSGELTYRAYHAIDSHTLGFTLWEAGYSLGAKDAEGFGETVLRELPRDYPYLAEHVEQHLAKSGSDEESEFEFGLELILEGLKRADATS